MSAESSTARYPDGSADAPADEVVELGGHLGRYRIDDVIGAGGRGLVLAAHDPELARAIALKVLRRHDAVSQVELRSEAQAMARLRHPNVVSVYDVGVVNDRVFIAMELVAGVTLRAWQTLARPWRSVVETYLAAASGLVAAHAAAVVHADFKPDNVLVGDDGIVRVADFGLTLIAQARGGGRIAGTPAYMAPEQHAGDAIGPAADQFAFATALWEALAGARPFGGAGADELHAAKRRGPPEPPRGAGPGWLFALLRRALAVDPGRRHASMTALVTALERGLARRRRWLGGGALVGAIAATAVIAAAFASREPRPDCSLARTAIEQTWRPETRRALAASFARSHHPGAATTATRVASEIDRRVSALAGAREASCVATYQRGEQSPDELDREVACLDRQAAQLAARVHLFVEQADDVVVDHAYEAIVSLPDPASCAGTDQPLPAPRIRAQVMALDQRRAGAEALTFAGHPLEARTALEALANEAHDLGFPPLVAAVEHDRARAIYQANDFAAAAHGFQAAAEAAAAAGDDARIAEAWLGLLDALSDGGKPRDAFDRLGFAEVAVARAGGARLREELLYTRGGIELEIDLLTQAKADLEAARASLLSRGQAHTLLDGRVENLLAEVVTKLDDNAAAVALYREALATFTDLVGEDHLSVAIVLNNLAMRLEEAGQYDEADRMLRRSLAIKERSFAPDNASIALALHNLGDIANARGDLPEAIALTERALAIRERALGPNHPLVASSLSNLAAYYCAMGRPAEALAAAQRSRMIREQRNGTSDVGLAFPLRVIAKALIDLGRAAEAEPFAIRARSIVERALGAGSSRTGIAWGLIGDVATALHRPAAGCAAYDRAVAILENARGDDHQYTVDPLSGQAECALAAGDLVRARAAADHALAIIATRHMPAYRGGRARLVRTQVLWATPATRTAALAEARQAVAAYDRAPPETAVERARAQRWLATHRG